MMNQGGNRGAMNFGRNRAKTQSKENIKVRFTDVAGAEEEKEELVEVVDFLKKMCIRDSTYAETEDQLRSIKEIKADMESDKPMDRLLVGDVGFGKTEVAMPSRWVFWL